MPEKLLPKIGCVIQGNYRPGTRLILEEISNKFDYVSFSTWEGTQDISTHNPKVEVLLNRKPKNNGYSNRNLQRISASVGIKACRENNCDYVLKLRSDMLPTKIDIQAMMDAIQNSHGPLTHQRVLIASTRTRSVTPDYFSCIPDFFQFGPIDLIDLIWDIDGFDFSKSLNAPPKMIERLGSEWLTDVDNTGVYFCAEQELYAWFQYRIEKKYGLNLEHKKMMESFFYAYDDFNMCWFGARLNLSPLSIGFRPTKPGIFTDWWSKSDWKNYNPKIYLRSEIDRPSLYRSLLSYLIAPYLLVQILYQYGYFFGFLLKKYGRRS